MSLLLQDLESEWELLRENKFLPHHSAFVFRFLSHICPQEELLRSQIEASSAGRSSVFLEDKCLQQELALVLASAAARHHNSAGSCADTELRLCMNRDLRISRASWVYAHGQLGVLVVMLLLWFVNKVNTLYREGVFTPG